MPALEPIPTLFERSLARLSDYLVALPELRVAPPREPFLRPPLRFSPLALASEPFLRGLEALDRACYGGLGLEMPRWALYDCGELPGVVAGFAAPAGEVPAHVREYLELPEDYAGPVPLSMAILIPHPAPGAWLCYSLCSINTVAPGAAPGQLRLLTLAAALARLDVRELWTIQQWRSPVLPVFSRLGPIELMSAYTPAHTEWKTLTGRVAADPERLRTLLVQAEPLWDVPTFWLDCDDEAALVRLQERIEEGAAGWVAGPPRTLGDRTLFPVRLDARRAPAVPPEGP